MLSNVTASTPSNGVVLVQWTVTSAQGNAIVVKARPDSSVSWANATAVEVGPTVTSASIAASTGDEIQASQVSFNPGNTVIVPGVTPPPPPPPTTDPTGPGPFVWDGRIKPGTQIVWKGVSSQGTPIGSCPGYGPGDGGFGGHPVIPAGQVPCHIVSDPAFGTQYDAIETQTWATQNPAGAGGSSAHIIPIGSDIYIADSVKFMSPFPTWKYPLWLQFFELYGPPYAGSPIWGMGINADNARGVNEFVIKTPMDTMQQPQLYFSGDPGNIGPVKPDTVYRWIAHVIATTDPNVGLLEIWLAEGNASYVQQTFEVQKGVTLTNGGKTARMATLGPSDSGGAQYLGFDNYHAHGVAATLRHWGSRVGKTLASVGG